MTETVLTWVAERKGITSKALAGLVVAPVLIATSIVDLWRLLARRAQVLQLTAHPFAVCPNGHEVELEAEGWECGACHATYPRNAFLACRCGETAAAVECPCGLTVDNPLWERSR